MALMRRTLTALTAIILLAFAACSPTATNNTASGNGNAAKPAANPNTPNANMANANTAAKSKPGKGTLQIASTPVGAGITLVPVAEDSAGLPQPYGATPATINDLAPGKYLVNVSKPGYKTFQKEVEVKADATAKIDATLKK